MQKRWFLMYLSLILILTYINITGEGIVDKGSCNAVTIEQGYNNLNLTTSCDEDYIEPVFSYN